MRLIDGDKLVSIFGQRKEVWRGNGVLPSTESLMWIAAMDITKNVPTVDAVPLDKLCERLVNFSECPSCSECTLYGIKCGEYGPCGSKEHWKAVLTKWMEEQDAVD